MVSSKILHFDRYPLSSLSEIQRTRSVCCRACALQESNRENNCVPIARSSVHDSWDYSEAMFWRVAFPLASFGTIASLSSERNAVNKSSALTTRTFRHRYREKESLFHEQCLV